LADARARGNAASRAATTARSHSATRSVASFVLAVNSSTGPCSVCRISAAVPFTYFPSLNSLRDEALAMLAPASARSANGVTHTERFKARIPVLDAKNARL
jgi:hypothetical protein